MSIYNMGGFINWMPAGGSYVRLHGGCLPAVWIKCKRRALGVMIVGGN